MEPWMIVSFAFMAVVAVIFIINVARGAQGAARAINKHEFPLAIWLWLGCFALCGIFLLLRH